jgi:OOP family OmpA-OmpF porin
MKKTILLTTLLLCGLSLAAVPAQAFYVGAGIGNTFFSSEYEDAFDQLQEIDENSTAWKIFGGWSSPSFFGIEGGYRDFGKIATEVGGASYKNHVKGWDIEVMGRFTIAIVDVFGKFGMMFWDSEVNLEGLSADASSEDVIWGLGAGVHLGGIGVRAEWESLETGGDDNLSMVSLSATLGF